MPFVVPAQFLTTDDSFQFVWPSLAELNEELMLELGLDGGMETDDGDGAVPSLGLYTGPPPPPPTCPNPFAIPPASTLAKQIIESVDKLFFISWKIGMNIREWRLVRVALHATTTSYPSCFDDGKYIVDFYTSHPSDSRMNAVNQRFWLRYHSRPDLMGPCSSSDTHLIRPTKTSEAYASRHNLLPFHQFVNLTHSDTFIHGPFDFATLGGRKSCDWVSGDDWRILRSHASMFQNLVPSEEITTYSVHIDAGAHTIFASGSPLGDISPLTALEREFQQLYP
jgi:hypothetical protein